MLQVNLLPDVKKEFIKAKRQRNLVMTVCIMASLGAGAVVVVLGVIMGGQQIHKNILMGNVDRDKQTIQNAQENKQLNEYLTVQNQLSQIDSLKESQPILSRLFDYIQELNPADPNGVELSSVRMTAGGNTAAADTTTGAAAESGGTIELNGLTANFASLNVYKTTLQRTEITYSDGEDGDSVTELLFTSVTVNEAGLSQAGGGGDQVSFRITVSYNAAAFNQNSMDVTLKIPQETTSDAVVNAPRNVFNNNGPTVESGTAGGGNGGTD